LIFSIFLKALTNYLMIRYTCMLEYRLGKRLTRGFLNNSYSWFLHQHSANLTKTIITETNIVVSKTVLPFINFLVYSLTSSGILLLLCYVNFNLAIKLGSSLILFYLLTFYFCKKILYHVGVVRAKANEGKFKSIKDAFGAIKEVKFLNIENLYTRRFATPALQVAYSEIKSNVISFIPRYAVEAICFGGIIFSILYLIGNNKPFIEFLPLFTLYAFAGYRLIPSLQQVYFATTRIRYSYPAVMAIYKYTKEFNLYEKNKEIKAMDFNESLELKNISYSYPNTNMKSLKDININIKANSKVGIIGSTGSGKSTLIDLILGIIEPQEGNLIIDKKIINKQNFKSWKKNIGYVPQQIFLIDESIKSNIAFGLEDHDIEEDLVINAAKTAKIHEFITNDLPEGYNTKIGEGGIRLSGGQKQRLAIARALYRKPKVLVFDEATSALDNYIEKQIMDDLYSLNKNLTMIIIAHRLNTIKKCDNIFLLDKGKILAQGKFEEIQNSSNLFIDEKN